MQAIRRTNVRDAAETGVEQPDKHNGSGKLTARIAAGVVLGFFLWFVNSLQGLTFDTVFLAIYWTLLLSFVVKSFISGFHSRKA